MNQIGSTKQTVITWVAVIAAVGIVVYGLILLGGGTGGNSNANVSQVSATDHTKGPENAPAVLIEYSDFQCPACGSYYPIVKQLEEAAKDKVRIVYRHFPLTRIHPNAQSAAWASEAANQQGKFWEMHDRLFENQSAWSDSSSTLDVFAGYASELGLDEAKFRSDYADGAVRQKVSDDIQSGNAAGVSATPSFFLNGTKINNPRSVEEFVTLIDDAAAENPVAAESISEPVHHHFDFRMVVEGQAVDFSQAKYQETKDNPLDEGVHFHDGNGEVVHIHEAGVTLGRFLSSIGFTLNQDCLKLDDGQTKCATGSNKVRVFVNGTANDGAADYRLNDLDRVLVLFGSESDQQLTAASNAVTDKACIYSESCPERGQPPTEECVGGLGTDCS